MPSPATSPGMLRVVPSFSQIRAEFLEDETTSRDCMATPYGNRCGNELTAERQSIAVPLITSETATLGLADVRTIITLLLCERCQMKYNHRHKNKLADKWQSEFPRLDLSDIQWAKDEYSLSRSVTPASTPRRTSSNTASTASTSSFLDTDSIRAFEASPSPSTRRIRRESSQSSTQLPSRPPLRPRLVVSQDMSRQGHNEDPTIDPLAISQALHAIRRTEISIDAAHDESNTALEEDVAMPDAPSSPSASFSPGNAFRWTPEMIIDNVENLLRSEIPASNRGSIYAFQQREGPHVKIGYTTQSREARRTQISTNSKIELDPDRHVWIENIELRLLLRLEKLVHADLAHAQRNLRITGTTNTRKTQHEWFEVDLETAKRSIKFWYAVVHQQQDVVELNDLVDQAYPTAETEADAHTLNQDHARRQRYWQQRVRLPQKYSLESVLRWFTGCFAIGIIPVFVKIPDRFVFSFFVFGIAVWTGLFTGRRWV